jgi:hypothetical protein
MTRGRHPSTDPSPAANARPAWKRGRRALPARLLLVLLACVSADGLSAQYSVGAGPSGAPTIPTRESFDEAISAARWNFGGLKVQPWAGLRDGSFVTNQQVEGEPLGNEETDFTITVGAGARAYLGKSKSIVAGHVLPEYVWWNDATEKRRLNGRYGLGYFGFFNRMNVEVSAQLEQEQGFFSEEIAQLTSIRQASSRAIVELALTRRFELYAFAHRTEFAGEETERVLFTQLDRTTTSAGLGLRYELAGGLRAEVGVEDGSVDFDDTARDYSNDFQTLRLGLGYDGTRISTLVELGFLEIDPAAGSTLAPFDDTTGIVQVRWAPSQRFDFAAYVDRRFRYSLESLASSYLSERQGVRIGVHSRLGHLGLIAAVGDDTYSEIDRVDDVTELHALIDFKIGRLLLVTLSAGRIDFDSTDALAARDVTRFGLSVQLGEIADRLRLGSDRGPW